MAGAREGTLRRTFGVVLAIGLFGSSSLIAGASAQDRNSATFDADGTARITRVIRPSATVSTEAQKWLESLNHRGPGAKNLAERRAGTDASHQDLLFPKFRHGCGPLRGVMDDLRGALKPETAIAIPSPVAVKRDLP